MGKMAWVDWATEHWKPLIDYIPTISLLSNGWIVCVFLEEAHCSHILEGIWCIDSGSLVWDDGTPISILFGKGFRSATSGFFSHICLSHFGISTF